MHVCWGVFFFFCTLTDQLCIAHKYRQRLQGDAGEEGEGRNKKQEERKRHEGKTASLV